MRVWLEFSWGKEICPLIRAVRLLECPLIGDYIVVCFLILNESTCHARKNVFYFSSKALFVLQKIKFSKYISLNNLRSKHGLIMKFGQFMSYYKRKISSKNSIKTVVWKIVPGPFCIYRELSTNSFGKWNFWSKLLILDM